MEGESHLIFFPQSIAILKAGLFCDLVGMNQRAPLTTRQRLCFWNKAWAKVCAYGFCSESVCRRKDWWRSTEAVHHWECGWIMDTVLHSQPFANPCSNATFPACAERFNGTNPRGLFLFIHLKPCFELLQTGHCPSQHTKHCTGAHTFHSAWQTSWTQSLIYIWS